jgi:amino acid adenylation domain-containing protein
MTAPLTPLRKATLVIKHLRQRLEQMEATAREPIAVIGLACRFPGAEDANAFWTLLERGDDATREVPPERWDVDAFYDPTPGTPGKMYCKRGGFIDCVDQFDPQFFRIAPREAIGIDPQQRLLLETCWLALEHAGLVPAKLVGSDTGVFLGISTNDYGQVLSRTAESSSNNAQAGAGNAASVASGRISYSFGFQGPCIAVDTACSSSLVATHLAVNALRNKECRISLVAGVNLMLAPEITINFCQGRMLSPDGRCKTFDANADGYARGEGCGVLVLKRLSDARADGDRVLAVIRGSAVNQDGRSSGLTAPNGRAQKAVIEKALANAGLEPDQVSYVEAHGTGTELGDPIEMQALAEVFAPGRVADGPLWIGSVKSNIGHLEAAAGVSAMIKVVLALSRRRIPANCHFHTLNPHIAADGFRFEIPTQTRAWPAIDNRHIAGVSSFGFSGTNVHVLIEAAPDDESAPAAESGELRPLCLSARTPAALRELAERYRTHLRTNEQSWRRICETALTRRSWFNERIAIVAEDKEAAAVALDALIAGRAEIDAAVAATASAAPPPVAFLFTGQGSLYPGMARTLFESEAVFRAVIERCAELTRDRLERPLIELLFDADESALKQTAYAQPLLFSLQVALAELWASWGITPAAVIGHSVGELAAACIAGCFDLEDGLAFACTRGQLMQSLAEGGVMTTLLTDPDRAYRAVEEHGGGLVSVAAENGPQAMVIAGPAAAVEKVLQALAAEGVEHRSLPVSHAFHSPLVEPCLDALESAAASLPQRDGRIDIISNVTAAPLRRLDAAYWRRHARYPVRFAQGLASAAKLGCGTFIEIGPQPVLIGLGKHIGIEALWLPSLSRHADNRRTLLQGLGELWMRGYGIRWQSVFPAPPAAAVALPGYPFQRERYWPQIEAQPRAGSKTSMPSDAHPLLGVALRLPLSEEHRFESWLDTERLPYLLDHKVYATPIVPGAALIELLQAAAEALTGASACSILDLRIEKPLRLDRGGIAVQLIARPDGQSGWECTLVSMTEARPTAVAPYLQHARARLTPNGASEETTELDPGLTPDATELPLDRFYHGFAERGLDYGAAFRGVHRLWRTGDGAYAELLAPARIRPELPRYRAHPALLDAALQVLAAALPGDSAQEAFLPVGAARVRLLDRLPEHCFCRARASRRGDRVTANLTLSDEQGTPLLLVQDLTLVRVARRRLLADAATSDWLYRVVWRPAARAEPAAPPAFLPAPETLARRLAERARQLAEREGLAVYAALEPEQERLSLAYAVAALRRLGAALKPGERFTGNGLAEALAVADEQRRLFDRLLEMLAEEGILARQGRLWTVAKAVGQSAPDTDCAALMTRFPTCGAELGLLRRCGSALDRVLRGELDPLPLLFPAPDKAEDGAGELYAESLYARIVNQVLADAVRDMVRDLPPGRSLRVLEVGAGTGATTRALLPALDAERTIYDFTDLSPWFENQSRALFRAWSGLRFRLLDVQRDPLAQGFEASSYDLIVAANVLHATRDLSESLHHLRRVLAPGGMLLLIESTAKRRWVDLVFGMTEGWWRFEDTDLRPDHPLLDVSQWLDLLAASGFTQTHSLPGGELIFAQKPAAAAPDLGHWLLIGNPQGASLALAEHLQSAGARCHFLPAEGQQELAAQLAAAGTPDWAAIVHLAGLEPFQDDGSADEELLTWQNRVCGSALAAAQHLIQTGGRGGLFLVSGHAGGDTATHSATLNGLGNTIALEHPELGCRCLNLDAGAADFAALCAELIGSGHEQRVRLDAGGRMVARLVPLVDREPAPDGAASSPIRNDASYLITGGLGGLGLAVAGRLVERGARTLVLVGRHTPGVAAQERLQRLRDQGARIQIKHLDVADTAALSRLFGEIADELPPLAGIVHAAGVLDNAPLREQDSSRFTTVFGAKVAGAWQLHCLSRNLELDFFVLFSSMAGVLGSAGQANHAAGATFLDALAEQRRRQGLPAISLDWGAWSEIGAAARDEVARQMAQAGFGTIAPDQGLAVFEWALAAQPEQAVVIPEADWGRFLGQFPHRLMPAFYAELAAHPASAWHSASSADMPHEAQDPLEALRSATGAQRLDHLRRYLGARIAEVIGLKSPPLRQTPLPELGFDSLMAVELKNRVGSDLGIELSVRQLLEGASLDTLANELLRSLDLTVEQDTLTAMATRHIEPDPAHRYEPFPLTDIQQAYWIGRGPGMELGGIGCHLYSEIEGADIPLELLQDAWRRLVAGHDMLRAVITDDGRQRILEQVPAYEIAVLDLSHLDAPERERRLAILREELSHRVFDATRWPLFDIRATRLDAHRTRLHLGFDLLVLDAASIFQLREEWVRLAADPTLTLPPLEISFRDLVLAEEAARAGSEYARAKAYWLERLPSLPGGPELPFAKDPASISRPHFVRRLHSLQPALWSKLKERAGQRGLTPSALLCAAYAEILAAWSRRCRFCLTLTIFNRPALHPQVNSLVGDFTSTILLEFDGSAQTFDERARNLAQRLAADLDHAAFGGVRVMREQARRSAASASAVPVVFTSALGVGSDAPPGAGRQDLGELVYSVAQTPQVLLDHQASEQAGALILTWDLVESLFPPGVPERMFQAYRRLLESLAAGDDAWQRRISDSLPAEEFVERDLANATDLPIPPGLLHAPFIDQATTHPERLALIDGERQLDYGELLARAGGVASELVKRRLAPGELVAVVMHKGWQQVVAVLGILGAGAAYLPVDAALPEERRHLLLADGAVRVALTSQALTLSWPDGVEALPLEALELAAMPLPRCAPDDLAYVIYTSGSTGIPKGVMIEHQAALNTVLDINRRYQVGAQDRVLALASLSFDLSVYDIFGVLGAGGALVFPGADGSRDPQRWVELIRRHRVSLWNSVPALMAMLCEYGESLGNDLRLVMLSGDWIPLELPERIRRLAPRARLIALGGATEAAIWSNYHEVEHVAPEWRSIPYGRPLANQRFTVLNDRLQACPVWLAGQLHIAGQGLARGYRNAPELTSQRFFVHPDSGDRLYATGDLGRYLPNGEIEFLGREDHQVKIRGHRIELGEIEAALARHPAVREVVVAALGSHGGERRLSAFVVPEATAATLRPAPKEGWESMLSAGRASAASLADVLDRGELDAATVALERLYLDATAYALGRLNAFSDPRQVQDPDSLIRDHSVAPRYRHWLSRALDALAAAGLLESTDAGHRAPLPLPDHPPDLAAVRAADRFGFSAGDFRLLERVIENLHGLLTERVHSAAIYTADETPEIYHSLFRFTLPVAADMVAALADCGAPLRILEVGAGLGTATHEILQRLPEQTECFVFSDISRYFLEAGRRRFGDRPFVEWALLDLERAATEQGFGDRAFDLIIAASVLHATADLAQSLIHLRRLLAPGGYLLLVEETRFHSWYDLSMGLQQGFDRFTDEHLRRDHPLIDHDAWLRLLDDTGFADAANLSTSGSTAETLGFSVLLARGPDDERALDARQLTDFLAARLPAPMMPSQIVLLDTLPLTGNGKLDRTALERLARPDARPAAAEPETIVEKKVAAIFAELTGAVRVSRDDSFFALGGNSLAMVQLYHRLRQDLGGHFDVAELFRSPDLASVAAMVERTAPIVAAGSHALVELRRGSAPPLFVIPGVVAAPYYLGALAERLAPEQGLYSFAAPGLNGGIALDTIESQAAYYLSALREIQPVGPYRLIGHSYGGYVAFEIARQLAEDGETVELLGLLDTLVVASRLTDFQRDEIAIEAIIRAFYALYEARLSEPYQQLSRRPLNEQLEIVMRQLQEQRLVSSSLLIDGVLQVFKANFHAMANYKPVRYAGTMFVVRSEGGFPQEMFRYETGEALRDPALGWSRYCAGIRVLPIAGDHLQMMNPPNVDQLADLLQREIDTLCATANPDPGRGSTHRSDP